MMTAPARLLGDSERAQIHEVLEREPIAAAQVTERVGGGRLSWRVDAKVLGYGGRGRGYSDDRQLESICWLGTNLIPVHASRDAATAFAEVAGAQPRMCSSLVGEAQAVLTMWDRLAGRWGPAREVRASQPLLATWDPAPVAPDPTVRLVTAREIDQLFPAAVAMYTEEVGVSPAVGDGGRDYRARITDLVRNRRAYAKFVDGQVIFKAELAVVTRHTAQVQGVWVAPQWRGRGVATAAMATVVDDALHRVAPSVSLYVNDYNTAARKVYQRCGFRRAGTFATVLL